MIRDAGHILLLLARRCGTSGGGRWPCRNHSPQLGQPVRESSGRMGGWGVVKLANHSDSKNSFHDLLFPPLSDKGSCLNGNRNQMHRPVQNEEER